MQYLTHSLQLNLVMAKIPNYNKILTKAEKWVIIGMKKSLDFRKEYAEDLSPTDTWKYIRSHQIQEPKKQWRFIVGANVNDADDAFWVEYGFRRTPVNRHKWPPRSPATRIFTWVWANVYTRTAKETKKIVLDQIRLSINEQYKR